MRREALGAVFSLFFLFNSNIALGENSQEKGKAYLVEGKGYACNTDIEVAKTEALKNAKLNALRKIETKIYASEIVENNYLLSQLILARYAGSLQLVGKPQYSAPEIKNNAVCVSVNATFKYKKQKEVSFHPFIQLENREVTPNSTFWVTLSVEKPCYGYLIDIAQDGGVYLVYPPSGSHYKFTPEQPHRIPLKAYPLPEFPYPQKETLVFLCFPQKVYHFNKLVNLLNYPGREKECLKDETCRASERIKDIWNFLTSLNYDLSIADFYIIEQPTNPIKEIIEKGGSNQ
jgi:hypothetical protein